MGRRNFGKRFNDPRSKGGRTRRQILAEAMQGKPLASHHKDARCRNCGFALGSHAQGRGCPPY